MIPPSVFVSSYTLVKGMVVSTSFGILVGCFVDSIFFLSVMSCLAENSALLSSYFVAKTGKSILACLLISLLSIWIAVFAALFHGKEKELHVAALFSYSKEWNPFISVCLLIFFFLISIFFLSSGEISVLISSKAVCVQYFLTDGATI